MDVRHFAFLARQPSAALKTRGHFLGLPKRGMAFLLANVMFWQPLWAQADGIVVSAPGTTLGQAGNGVPIVNIAAPNGSGLSHNQFHDYNVGANGVILNNATARTQSTQLGGIILGNSNLNGRAATTILNEVNGGSPSQLRGYTEVAGQSAHVIVANPYGISCSGCGFINTPQATLTTGKPVISNGQVSGYQVDQGSVSIEGAGLNANNIDQFEIITRSARLNAEIQAKNLAIIAGANDVDAKTLKATARTANPANAPQLAIDSSALGGMYAGAIKLVGTEAGVGVKLDGKMVASGGDIQLDANGHLSMVDTAASGAVNLKAQSLEAKGPVYAGTTLDMQTQGDLSSQNNLVAKDRITLNSGGQLTNNGIIEAGVNLDNTRNSEGDVSVTAQNLNNAGKTIIASRDLSVTTTQTLNNQGGTLSGQRQTTVTAGTLDNQNKGRVLSAAQLNLTADKALNGQGGLINSVGQLSATLGHLNNNGAEVSSKGDATLILGTMDNLTGVVMAENTLGITASDTLNNQNGLLSGWQGLTLNGTTLDNRNSGTVSSRNGDVGVTLSGALLNSHAGAVVSQKSLTVRADSLDNSDKGVLSSAAGQRLTVTGLLDNSLDGSISSGAALTLQAMALNNGGTVSAVDALSFTGTDLDNSNGTFSGNAGVTLDLLGTLTNTNGKLSSVGPLLVQRSAQINNQNGGINSQGLLTLLTGGLDNSHQGTIGANDTLLVTASGAVDNSGDGLIASRNADLQLTAASLGNGKGSLQGKGAVNLTVSGDIDNQSGKVIAQDGDLGVSAANLDSRGGTLSSVKGALETQVVGVLKNGYDQGNNSQGGTLQAQRLMLNALGGIDNNGGRIAAQAGDAVLDARSGNIDNRNGGLYAGNLVRVNGNDLDNSGDQGGKISGSEISFSLLGKLNNRKGIIESGSTLSTTAASLDNQNGQLRALGKSFRTVFAIGGLLDNSNGTLETANTDLGLDVGSFQNLGGSVLHVGTGIFGLSMANLNDVGGQLVTHGDLTLDGDNWTNSSSLQANHLTVNVNHLTQTTTGQLLATAGLNGTGVDWNNDGQIGTDGRATVDLTGSYGGKGRLSSADDLDLHAALINLDKTGSIAAGGISTVNVDGVLSSYGRLTSAADMTVTAAGISNYGTLGSAQKFIATTGALLNDHGLIFSGGDMGLRVDSLNNSYANVYSMGNLTIDRDGQGALASRIVNSSGSIQSDASMRLAASTIQNVRAVLTTNDQGIYTASIGEIQCIEGYNAGDCSGKQNHVWQIVQRDKFEVTEASAASGITAGSNLTIKSADLLNSSSTIAAGGALSATVTNLTNSGIETGETETSRTFRSERTKDAGGLYAYAASFNNSYWFQSAGYNPNNVGGLLGAMSGFIGLTEAELGQFQTSRKIASSDQSYAAVIQAGGAVSVNAQNGITSSVVRPGYTYVGAGPRTDTLAPANTFSTRITVNQQLPPDLAQQQVNPVSLPGFSLPVGDNGLFRLSGQTSTTNQPSVHVPGLPDTSARSSPQKYLIETNPVLTDLKQFMSSDYLLSNLGYDPQTSAKRLGDGFYEQKLIQQAVTARTGQRFIDGQTSDDDMFKYLMNNAVASKQQLDLQLGVSLTSEQVAALTHDIVWMENQTVNGEQVLVPVLYLASANNRLAANGALIQGSDVTLIAGKELNNAGTLRASNNLSATAGNDLVNSGLLEAGNRLDALAGHNLTNKAGGIIAGRDVSITATTGDVTNERTLTTHESGTGYKTEQRGFADSAARIEAGNNLTVTAGRDIANSGGVLKSTQDTVLKAGRDVNITSAEQVNSNTLGDHHNDRTITQNGSSITSGRDLAISAGRDLTAVASQINAKRDVALSAVDDLTLSSAADEQHSYGRTKKVTSQEDHSQQVSTSLNAGGKVSLNAGKDLQLVASRVGAGDEAYLVAGANLTLQSAKDDDYSFYSKTSKNSSGKKSRLDEVASSTNVGSLVTSGSNSTLVAGANILVQGSTVSADKGAARLVAGTDVQVIAETDSSSARHESSKSKSSWGGFKSSKVQDAVSETRTEAVGSMISGDSVSVVSGRDATVSGSSLVSTQDLSVQAGRDLTINAVENTFTRTDMHKEKSRDLTGMLTANNLGVDDITGNLHLSIGNQKHNGNAQETTLTGSTVGSSQGSVQLAAGRALNVVASDLVSTQDMALTGADVNIVAGTEKAHQSSADSSQSLAVGRVVGGVIVDTVKSIRNDIRAAQNADDGRLKAVKGAQALLSAYNAVGNMSDSSAKESDGKPANSGGSMIKIGTELASTHSKNTSEYSSETAKQSSVISGAGLAITATGSTTGSKGDIHVNGSSLKAADTLLSAKNNITLESAQDRSEWDNQNSNNKLSIGASFNLFGDQNGFTLDLGAQIAKGMGSGSGLTQVNSTLDTGLLVLKSGKDTTLAGAQVRADTIKADVGGNLSIASRQDESDSKNRQTSGGVGASICIPPFCWGSMVSGSANIAASKMNSEYKAVTDQTGLYAGKGGYDITVGSNTQLEGAVIASDATADKNRLSTDRLIVSDIKNRSSIESQAASLSVSYTSAKGDNPNGPKTPEKDRQQAKSGTGGGIPIALSESDHSYTRSAVSEGTIIVRNAAGANDLVGLNRDTTHANEHLDRPDEKAMQERIDLIQSSAQLASSFIETIAKAKTDAAEKLDKNAVTPAEKQAAAEAAADARSWNVGGDKRIMADIASGLIAAGLGGSGGATTVGIVANTTANDTFKKIGDFADTQKKNATDEATRAAWAEGGPARVLLHALAGAAMGLSSGSVGSSALGAGASAALMPAIAEALGKTELNEFDQKALATLISTGLGTAVGSSSGIAGAIAGGGSAAKVEQFNRQLHPDERKLARILAELSDGKYTVEQIEAQMRLSNIKGTDIGVGTDIVASKDGIYDDGGNWIELGTSGKYFQQFAKPDLDIISFIQQYNKAYEWAALPAISSPDWSKVTVGDDKRDKLSGRVLDEKGGYREPVEVAGQAFTPRFLPCADAECNSIGANIDLQDSETKRWLAAVDAKALDDALFVGSFAPVGRALEPVGKILGTVFERFFGKAGAELVAGGGVKGELGRIEPPIPKVDVTNDFIMSVSNGGTTLRYGNPEGVAGLVVNVDKTGVLGFEIRAAQNHPFYDASGTDMFASAMQRLGNEGIQVNQIRGAWEAGTDSVNTAQYLQNIANGMSKENAALNTWTGQISQKYGYTKVEKIDTIGGIIYVTFGK
ncbi:hemagglutinin repeat-containing protein [Pseudomonas gingeri]|nr:hemagglutinin repeat-containing protein [Pseudomonas gingeri]NWA10194.1 hemagglutinin repeat-containing protein [Pseudomonas gingeri]